MRVDRQAGTLRLRAAFALLLAVLAFLTASLRAPTLALPGAAVAAAVGSSIETRIENRIEGRAPAPSVELHRVAAARPARGTPPRAPRVDRDSRDSRDSAAFLVFAPSELVATAAPTSIASPFDARASWVPTAKSHADLMVFLN